MESKRGIAVLGGGSRFLDGIDVCLVARVWLIIPLSLHRHWLGFDSLCFAVVVDIRLTRARHRQTQVNLIFCKLRSCSIG